MAMYGCKEIDRQLFVTLERDNRHQNHYFVFNDMNKVDDFWADSDKDAMDIFHTDYVA